MRILCVIPARLGSTRLPNKPLRLLAGEPLVCAVVRRVREWHLADEVVVATDDCRVAQAVAPLGVAGMLTDPSHRSGTERVAEVAARPSYRWADVVLNVQGDEPLLPVEAARGAAARVVDAGDPVGTAAVSLMPADVTDPGRVKVVLNGAGHALRFSRAMPASAAWDCDVVVRRHLGVYAYERAALARWVGLPPVPEEATEGLEQLRPLAYGWSIGVAPVAAPASAGIDTAADLARAAADMNDLTQRAGR